jgi:hypothetical protein
MLLSAPAVEASDPSAAEEGREDLACQALFPQTAPLIAQAGYTYKLHRKSRPAAGAAGLRRELYYRL